MDCKAKMIAEVGFSSVRVYKLKKTCEIIRYEKPLRLI